MSIQFLDCTLRDGAHVNGGDFGKEHILNIISSLSAAHADIVEIGFLKNVEYQEGITSYSRIEYANKILEEVPDSPGTKYAAMARADQYNIDNLSECNGKVTLIRVAFYYDYLEKAIEFARKVKAKGYDFTLNLINTPGNSLESLRKFVDYANEIEPYAVTLVDTFGVLDVDGMSRIADMYDANLKKSIRIGLHVHENMSSAFALAQRFLNTVGKNRNVIVDGSLMGMGRAPGNLCTELICNYLNENDSRDFVIPEILDSISKDIMPIKRNHKWGYSPEYFISAKYRVHRSYAEYLSDNDVNLKKIDKILSKIDREHALKFNREYLLHLMKEEDE
jgi:4-hydroxy 2-oxovalerate aldolase